VVETLVDTLRRDMSGPADSNCCRGIRVPHEASVRACSGRRAA